MAQKQTAKRPASNKPKSSTSARSSSAPKKSTSAKSKKKTANNDEIFRRQIVTVVLFSLGVLLVCLSLIKGDSLWNTAHQAIYGLFGLPCVLWFVSLLILTVMYAQDKPLKTLLLRTAFLISLMLLINSGLTVFSLNVQSGETTSQIIEACRDLGKLYKGGGIIGGVTAGLAIKVLGKVGAIVVWLLLLFMFIMISTKTSIAQLVAIISAPFASARERRERIMEERMEKEEIIEEPVERRPRRPYEQPAAQESKRKRKYLFADDEEEAKPQTTKAVPKKKTTKPEPAQDEAELDEEMDSKLQDLIEVVTGKKKKRQPVEQPKEKPAPRVAVVADETEPEVIEEQPDLDEIVKKAAAPAKKKSVKESKAAEVQEQAQAVEEEIKQTEAEQAEEREQYEFPPIDLLSEPDDVEIDVTDELKENAKRLIMALEEYGVKASVSDISCGPTVTRYEIVPAPGVKINRITTLANDIALRLAAESIRIEAPIPGKSAVGIEIPNAERKTVSIRELIDSDAYKNATGSLVAVVGKDIEGNLVMCDIAKMPHLLIAGSTGSGKSVCVNSMLISLMYKYTPDELRMVLVDPKKVEFEVYNGIPHLLVPVVCNAKKAAGVLQWAVVEMQRRYEMLQSKNVRSLAAYNKLAEESGEFEKMSKIIIVIDEMADLMQSSPKEVDDAIARLAAMARAAGMYMVLATQRPSVDVITGTIKNNIPSRIALSVSSQIDSRTILGTGGAEALIGYGDMLYAPMGMNKPKRVQGCFISDGEVEAVIKFLKRNGNAEYDASITEEIDRKAAENEKTKSEGHDEGGGFMDEDPTMAKAIEAVIQAGQASVSLLQRKLGVGYARAGKLIDQLEERGIVGPYEGSKPRAVLITKTQWLEMTMSTGVNSAAGTGLNPDQGFISDASQNPPFDVDDDGE